MVDMLVKALYIIGILLICYYVNALYKVYDRLPDRGTDKGNVALGIIAEFGWAMYLFLNLLSK